MLQRIPYHQGLRLRLPRTAWGESHLWKRFQTCLKLPFTFSPNSCPPKMVPYPLGAKCILQKSSMRVFHPSQHRFSPWVLLTPHQVAHHRSGQASELPVFRTGIYFSLMKVFSWKVLYRIHSQSMSWIYSWLGCVSYVPNGFSQVKVLQARANTIFRQDKVTVL